MHSHYDPPYTPVEPISKQTLGLIERARRAEHITNTTEVQLHLTQSLLGFYKGALENVRQRLRSHTYQEWKSDDGSFMVVECSCGWGTAGKAISAKEDWITHVLGPDSGNSDDDEGGETDGLPKAPRSPTAGGWSDSIAVEEAPQMEAV